MYFLWFTKMLSLDLANYILRKYCSNPRSLISKSCAIIFFKRVSSSRSSPVKITSSTFYPTVNSQKKYSAFTSKISNLFVPRNIQKALDDPGWKSAVMEEMNAPRKSETWEIVDLPKDHNTVGCNWVFTIKYKADGSIERYKARLVAKGVYSSIWGGLLRDLCSSCQNKLYSCTIVSSS